MMKVLQKSSPAQIDRKNAIITKIYGAEPVDKEAVTAEYLEYARRLRPYVRDTGVLVYEAVKSGKKCYLRELRGDARYRFGHLSVRNQLPSGFRRIYHRRRGGAEQHRRGDRHR